MNSARRETILYASMYTLRDLVCNGQMCPDRKCGPRLSAAAAEKLKNRYVVMRSGAREHERESDRRASIPITIRYGDVGDMVLHLPTSLPVRILSIFSVIIVGSRGPLQAAGGGGAHL